ncbi:hypothetical protein QUB05_26370 [Microcoleus sp. F10-C6]|uniref:hypothetical protein n=1 Tax=unclassified Microcoleus TaxID=2642155 RepID=UPI002FD38EF3
MQLTQTKQCANYPWKVDRDLSKIPGYNRDNHCILNGTIANPDIDISEVIHQVTTSMRIMGCHYSTDEKLLECVGWIYNQLRNNNLALRLALMRLSQIKKLEIDGAQRATFAETLKD